MSSRRKNFTPRKGDTFSRGSSPSTPSVPHEEIVQKLTIAINHATSQMLTLSENYLFQLREDSSDQIALQRKNDFQQKWNVLYKDVQNLKNVRQMIQKKPEDAGKLFAQQQQLYLKHK